VADRTPQRYVLGIAHQAGRDEKIRPGMDGGRDWFSPEELEKAAWNFLQSGPTVGLAHADGTTGSAQIVESYIYRGPDWNTGDVIVKSGDWLVGAILNEYAWQLYKAGYIDGWSIQGSAYRLESEQ
jgi:hypothetical protein